MEPLSVVIMTLNEEKNIERCIQSLGNLPDQILVVDSGSTDRTVPLAEQLGAKVVYHPFVSYRAQREYSIQMAEHDWVLALDADEFLDAELRSQLAREKANRQYDVYEIRRRNMIGEQIIYYGGWGRDRKIRLFKRDQVYQPDFRVHDQILPIPKVLVGKLSGYLMHRTNEDLKDRIKSINNLSSAAALEALEKGKKSNWWRVLIRPSWRFFREYVLESGFLDGYWGYVIAKSSAQYVFLREVKMMEQQRQRRG